MGVRLPAEYQEVEYLESTGTQYIKTNYRPSRYDKVDCEFWLDTIPISTWIYYALFSAGNTDPQFIFLIAKTPDDISRPVNGAYYKYFASNTATNFYFYPVAKEIYSLHIDQNGLVSCNGYTAQSNYVGDVNTDLYLFIRANNAAAFDGRIYKFQITNSGETKLNLIPCYRKSDSKPGMYDLVTNQFFTNAGTGDFLVGPDVIDSISPWLVAWRRIMMAAASVAKKLVKLIATSTTGLVSFDTNVKMPTKVTCEFSPAQEGTGDPSPDNVRPISGWTGCEIGRCVSLLNGITPRYESGYAIRGDNGVATVYGGIGIACLNYIDVSNYIGKQVYLNHRPTGNTGGFAFYSGTTESSYISGFTNNGITTQGEWIITIPDNPNIKYMRFTANPNYLDKVILCLVETKAILPINWQTEAGTIYGGTVTLNEDGSADVVRDRKSISLESLRWHRIQDYAFYSDTNGDGIFNGYGQGSMVCDIYATSISRVNPINNPNNTIAGRDGYRGFIIHDDNAATEEELISIITGHQVVYKLQLSAQTSYHFDNIGQLNSFIGTNNIWHNMNGDVTVEYWNKQ